MKGVYSVRQLHSVLGVQLHSSSNKALQEGPSSLKPGFLISGFYCIIEVIKPNIVGIVLR